MRKEAVGVLLALLGGWAQAQGPAPQEAIPPGPVSASSEVTQVQYLAPNAFGVGPAAPPDFGMGYIPGYPAGTGPGTGYGMASVAAADPDGRGGPLGRAETIWVNADYLLSRWRRAPLNTPLVTIGSLNDAAPGALGQPGTSVGYTRDNFNFGTQSGVRVEIGASLDCQQRYSVEAAGIYYPSQTTRSRFASDATGNPLITRPLFDTQAGSERGLLTSLPDVLSGTTSVEARTELYGFETNGRCNVAVSQNLVADLLVGYRYLRLEERLTIRDQLNPLLDGAVSFLGAGNPVPLGSTVSDVDQFSTRSMFNGVNLGLRGRWKYDWLLVTAYGKTAVGVTSQRVNIAGSTTLTGPGVSQTTPGGVLALPSNIGSYSKSTFGVIPEAGLTLGLEPCKHVRVTAGYSFLYWNSVVRPGNQIDRNVNPAFIPTTAQFANGAGGGNSPQFTLRETGFWMHTFSAGLEFYY